MNSTPKDFYHSRRLDLSVGESTGVVTVTAHYRSEGPGESRWGRFIISESLSPCGWWTSVLQVDSGKSSNSWTSLVSTGAHWCPRPGLNEFTLFVSGELWLLLFIRYYYSSLFPVYCSPARRSVLWCSDSCGDDKSASLRLL